MDEALKYPLYTGAGYVAVEIALDQRLGGESADHKTPQDEEKRQASGPIEYTFYSYFPERRNAETASARFRKAGLDATVEQHANTDWLVLARGNFVPGSSELDRIEESLTKAAESLGGEYDGNEAEF